jgi:hypothetical protein
MRRPRSVALLLCCLTACALSACDSAGGDGYGCQGRTCTASFQGPGEQDLSSKLGKGATVQVVTVDGSSATVRIAGQDAKLVTDQPQRVAGYEVTLTDIDGEDVTLRIVGA